MDRSHQHDLALVAELLARAVEKSEHTSADAIERQVSAIARRHGIMRQAIVRRRGGARSVGVVVLLSGGDEVSLLEGAKHAGLSPRECTVAIHVANGERNREIARALRISENTVRHHVERILAKLGAGSRHQVARQLAKSASSPPKVIKNR